jgi:hypothetical protein
MAFPDKYLRIWFGFHLLWCECASVRSFFRKLTGRLLQLFISPHEFSDTLIAAVLSVSVVCFHQLTVRNDIHLGLHILLGLRRCNDNCMHDGDCK